MPRPRFSPIFSAFLTGGVLAFLWVPILWLYGGALWPVVTAQPARLIEALPLAPVPRTLFLNTFFLCATTALLSLIPGTVVATFLAWQKRYNFALVLIAMPLAVSPTLMATAYLEISRTPPLRAAASLGAEDTLPFNSIFIAAPILALCFYPIVAFAIGAAQRAIPEELIDAGRLFSDSWNTWTRVLLPLLAPAAMAASGIVAALSIWEMGAPDLLDVRTYSVQIYRDFSAQQNTQKAAMDALPMFALGALCFLPAMRAVRFYKGLETTATSYSRAALSTTTALATLSILALSPVAPLWIFASQLQSSQILWKIWEVNRNEIFNTLVVANVASILVAGVGFVVAITWREFSVRTRGVLLLAALGSLLCAPIMLAMAYLSFYNLAIFDFIYSSRYALLLLGLIARFLPVGVLWLHEALARIPRDYFEAATGLGAAQGYLFSTIIAPLIAPAAVGLFAVSWALCATELSLSVLLNAPGGQTLPVPIFNQMHIGATAEVAALALTLVAMGAGVLGLPGMLWLWMGKSHHHRNK